MEIERVACVGGGLVGQGWATIFLSQGIEVILQDVSQEILDRARKQGSDFIILGDKGKGAVRKFLLGSVTPRIAHHASCSVLVVRRSQTHTG